MRARSHGFVANVLRPHQVCATALRWSSGSLPLARQNRVAARSGYLLPNAALATPQDGIESVIRYLQLDQKAAFARFTCGARCNPQLPRSRGRCQRPKRQGARPPVTPINVMNCRPLIAFAWAECSLDIRARKGEQRNGVNSQFAQQQFRAAHVSSGAHLGFYRPADRRAYRL